jgi:hypothetical protein
MYIDTGAISSLQKAFLFREEEVDGEAAGGAAGATHRGAQS